MVVDIAGCRYGEHGSIVLGLWQVVPLGGHLRGGVLRLGIGAEHRDLGVIQVERQVHGRAIDTLSAAYSTLRGIGSFLGLFVLFVLLILCLLGISRIAATAGFGIRTRGSGLRAIGGGVAGAIRDGTYGGGILVFRLDGFRDEVWIEALVGLVLVHQGIAQVAFNRGQEGIIGVGLHHGLIRQSAGIAAQGGYVALAHGVGIRLRDGGLGKGSTR